MLFRYVVAMMQNPHLHDVSLTSVPMCTHSFKCVHNRASSSNDYSSNFVIASLDSSFPAGFPHPTTSNSASHQPASPYFLHNLPRPPQDAPASFKSRYRKSFGDLHSGSDST